MMTVLIFFAVLSILVIVHELGHFFAAKKAGVKVEEFGFGIPPRVWGIRFGETLYSINLLPFGGFVKLFGEEEAELKGLDLNASSKSRSFTHKKPWQKAIILTAGVLCNFLLGWAIVTYLFTKGIPVPSDVVKVEEVVKSSPAAEAGLMKGDRLESASLQSKTITIDTNADVTKVAKDFSGQSVMFSVKRGEEDLKIAMTPRKDPPKGEGALGVVISNYELKQYPLYTAPYYALIESANMTAMIFRELTMTLVRFVTFQKQTADIAGPVGIAKLTSQAASNGLDSLLSLIGLLSLNLAVVNILPFPALDGGRLMFVLYEWFSRKRINPDIEKKLNFVGFSILIGLILLVTVQDIVKLFS